MVVLKLLDLKSIPCPLNVVKIKLALEKLSHKETLLVQVDKGEPEEMVYKNLEAMGYSLKKIQEDKNSIRIKISNDN